MFTLDQIKAAHAKVKSGADFPNYIKELISLGVSRYETFVADGNTVYAADNGEQIASGPKYTPLTVQDESNSEQFIRDLKHHQQGGTNYPTFCSDSAKAGVEKWVVEMKEMTCSYLDKQGNVMLTEHIPSV